jgi:hypothetical protein
LSSIPRTSLSLQTSGGTTEVATPTMPLAPNHHQPIRKLQAGKASLFFQLWFYLRSIGLISYIRCYFARKQYVEGGFKTTQSVCLSAVQGLSFAVAKSMMF